MPTTVLSESEWIEEQGGHGKGGWGGGIAVPDDWRDILRQFPTEGKVTLLSGDHLYPSGAMLRNSPGMGRSIRFDPSDKVLTRLALQRLYWIARRDRLAELFSLIRSVFLGEAHRDGIAITSWKWPVDLFGYAKPSDSTREVLEHVNAVFLAACAEITSIEREIGEEMDRREDARLGPHRRALRDALRATEYVADEPYQHPDTEHIRKMMLGAGQESQQPSAPAPIAPLPDDIDQTSDHPNDTSATIIEEQQ